MTSGFRPHHRDRTTESMEGFGWVLGQFGKVLGCKTKGAFAVTRLTVGVPNDLQMARNLTGGLPVPNQGRLTRLGPFRESLTPAHKREAKGGAGEHRSAGCKTDNGEKARMHETNTYAK